MTNRDSGTQKTHFADDETLAHIAKLERELTTERKLREAAERDARRFVAWFGGSDELVNFATLQVHGEAIQSDVTLDDWREAIDAALEEGK